MSTSSSPLARCTRTPIAARALLLTLAASVLLGGSAALAQAAWTPTGSVRLELPDTTLELSTYVTHVADDLAQKVDDADARAVAEKVAGTDQHTATWMLTDPVKVGGNVLVPARLFVLVDARAEGDPAAGSAAFHLEFALDPATLELVPDAEIALRYAPAGADRDGSFRTDEGAVTLERVERLDDHTLAIRGSAHGELEPRGEGNALPLDASFALDAVVGASELKDLLGSP